VPTTGTDNEAAEKIGVSLRNVRESQGKTVDEAARVTRIGKNYLLAIEDGTFDKLPSVAYTKGFLRIYASYLGLSGDDFVRLFEESRAAAPTVKNSEEGDAKGRKKAAPPGDKARGRWALPVILLALIIFTASLMNRGSGKHDRAEQQLTTPQSAQAPSPVQAVLSSTRTAHPVPAPVKEESAVDRSPRSGEEAGNVLILRIKANQDGWLNITIDNALSQSYDLKSGDIIEWKGEKSIALDLGNAGGVEAELNGKPLGPFGATGQAAHIVLTDKQQ
jgi:cytoskeleton protein RodZ